MAEEFFFSPLVPLFPFPSSSAPRLLYLIVGSAAVPSRSGDDYFDDRAVSGRTRREQGALCGRVVETIEMETLQRALPAPIDFHAAVVMIKNK